MRYLILAAISLLAAAAVRAEQVCNLQRIAVIPFETDDSSHIYIPATIAGVRTRLMLDTGGWWSVVRNEIADAAGLKARTSYDVWIVDSAGKKQDKYVTVPELRLGATGNVVFGKPVDFVVVPGLDSKPIEQFGGTIGLNFFTRMDLEIDNAGKTISLFKQDHCKGAGVHWANEAVTLRFKRDPGNPIAMPIVAADLEGQIVRTLIDTGSTVTSMQLEHAKRRFGLTPQTPGVEPSGQIHLPGGSIVETYSYTFKALTISGIRFENVTVHLGDFDEADLVLGMNEIKKLHLYFAFKDQMIHITAADAGR
jgi:predicted aspartyl protease